MSKVDIAGLKVDAITKQDFLAAIEGRLLRKEKTFVITPYSEFLYTCFRSTNALRTFNSADFAIADGIGILWAATYLHIPLTRQSYYGKILQAWWQVLYSGSAILFNPSYIRRLIPEKIVGADIVWDLCALAERNKLSVYILGGFGDTDKRTAKKFVEQYRHLKIAGSSNKHIDDPTILDDVRIANPDMLFVAFGPVQQEQWIAENFTRVPGILAIGLGGTFDYIAGDKITPPKFFRGTGLEWMFRLITQPSRFMRIKRGVLDLILYLVRYKVFTSCSYRQNAVGVIINNENKVLVCQRNPRLRVNSDMLTEKFSDYWQLPQGGVGKREELVTAAKREVAEETGLLSLEYLYTSPETNSYTWNNALRRLTFNKRYAHKGQEQRIVYFRFTGTSEEIKLDNREFINYKWVAPSVLHTVIHEERRRLTDIIEREIPQILQHGS